jgi:hypothetical protein
MITSLCRNAFYSLAFLPGMRTAWRKAFRIFLPEHFRTSRVYKVEFENHKENKDEEALDFTQCITYFRPERLRQQNG